MVAMPCRFLATSLRPTPVQAPPASADSPRNRLLPQSELLLVFAGYLIALFIGVVATTAWQSWHGAAGPAARPNIPVQQQLDATLLRRNVDQIAAHVAALEDEMKSLEERLGTGQDKLAASQEQMTTNLQALLSRTVEPSWRLAPAPVPTLVQKRSQAPGEADARADWRRQPCCQWPISSTR